MCSDIVRYGQPIVMLQSAFVKYSKRIIVELMTGLLNDIQVIYSFFLNQDTRFLFLVFIWDVVSFVAIQRKGN